MIDAAERLAAERGIGAMSLREVQAASGQRNKSAAQYHFGSREGLIEAVVAARMAPINARRAAMLDGATSVRGCVEALVVPIADATLRPGSCWARFLFQGFADPAVSKAVRSGFEGKAYQQVRERLAAAIDHVPEPLRATRLDHADGVLVMSLAAAETGRTTLRPDVLVANLVDTCTAILEAPASEPTNAALARRT
jgi:AcrR family transcriptional regulator